MLNRQLTDQLLQGDCLEVVQQLPTNFVPTTVTSPPYDNLRDYGAPEFTFAKFQACAEELYRITMDGGVVAWVVQDGIVPETGITGTSHRQAAFFQELGFRIHDEITVRNFGKRGGGVVRYGPPEKAFVFSKGRPRHINLIRDKKNKHSGSVGTYTRRTKDGKLEVARSGVVTKEWGVLPVVWEYSATRDRLCSDHPATMPEGLAEDLILSWSRPGDLIFDPFAGAGTTLKMALLNNRRYLGIEFVATFCELTRNRLAIAEAEHRHQLDEELFGLFDHDEIAAHDSINLLTRGTNGKLGKSVFVFNLPVFETCPGKSAACSAVCYADKGYCRYPHHRAKYADNLAASRSPEFVRRVVRELRLGKARLVRPHSSGDFFDAEYIRNWRRIAAASPFVTFWAYTRSWRLPELLEELKLLAELPNFHLWFSADQDTGLPPQVKNVRACWLQMGDESPPTAQGEEMPVELIFPTKQEDRVRYKRIESALVCPTYNGTMAGSETTCETCGVCWRRGVTE